MNVFVIFRVSDPLKLEEKLVELGPDRSLKLLDGQYLVSGTGTAKNLSDQLGISDGPTGAAIVFRMENYYGRANPDTWEWIKSAMERPVGQSTQA